MPREPPVTKAYFPFRVIKHLHAQVLCGILGGRRSPVNRRARYSKLETAWSGSVGRCYSESESSSDSRPARAMNPKTIPILSNIGQRFHSRLFPTCYTAPGD